MGHVFRALYRLLGIIGDFAKIGECLKSCPVSITLRRMKTVPVEIRGGLLALPAELKLPPRAHLAVLVVEEDESTAELQTLADAGGAFDFLREEPDLYSDTDVLPSRKNPRFGSPH